VIELIGRINKCGVISPRFDVTLGGIEQWTNNLLPSRQFGYIVMTTSLGIMDHEEVRPQALPAGLPAPCLSYPPSALMFHIRF
jgi:ribosomal protein S8